MAQEVKILFFGSTSDSVIIIDSLYASKFRDYTISIVGVVTQPPKPIGRTQEITPTPVEIWAKKHGVPVLSFSGNPEKAWEFINEQTVIDTLQPLQADLLVSASYGQKIPTETIRDAQYGGINVHPSLLPRWRGGDPVPWTILAGDHQAGVTITTLQEDFDAGKILGQNKIPVPPDALPDPFRTTLFQLGSELLSEILPEYLSGTLKGHVQQREHATSARRYSREDGFIPWDLLQSALGGTNVHPDDRPAVFRHSGVEHWPIVVERAVRALSPWPGVWTMVQLTTQNIPKPLRLKILESKVAEDKLQLITVQLEGKNPTPFTQLKQMLPLESQTEESKT